MTPPTSGLPRPAPTSWLRWGRSRCRGSPAASRLKGLLRDLGHHPTTWRLGCTGPCGTELLCPGADLERGTAPFGVERSAGPFICKQQYKALKTRPSRSLSPTRSHHGPTQLLGPSPTEGKELVWGEQQLGQAGGTWWWWWWPKRSPVVSPVATLAPRNQPQLHWGGKEQLPPPCYWSHVGWEVMEPPSSVHWTLVRSWTRGLGSVVPVTAKASGRG